MREVLTAYDVVTTAMDFLGGGGSSIPLRSIKAALNSALRRITAEVKTCYMQKHGRVRFAAPLETGTIAYDHTGGAAERLVTLTGSTFPTDAVDYSILIDDVLCDIETYVDSTHVTLDLNLNPGADVAAGTAYKLVRRYYRLPEDFDATEGFCGDETMFLGEQVPPAEIMRSNALFPQVGSPIAYAIGGIQDQINSLGLFVYPFADDDTSWDYLYWRKPREIRHTGYAAGDYAGTVTSATSAATVTGSSTAFAETMEGAIIRFSSSATVPTGFAGATVFQDERLIHSVASTTSLTIDRVVSANVSDKAYVITDPIDIDPSLYDLYVTRVLLDMAILRDMPNKGELQSLYREQLHAARIAANKHIQPTQPRNLLTGSRRYVIVSDDL